MSQLTFHSAGESHGRGCFAFVEGIPYGLAIDNAFIDEQLARRQKGYGRGGRMKIETDKAEVLSGVRRGISMGAPILLAVWNKDYRLDKAPELDCPRPGHADLAGHLKFNAPIRDILERASARETSARVACGALCRLLLKEFGIEVRSHVVALGPVELPADFQATWDDLARADASEVRCLDAACDEKMRAAIDDAKKNGDTLGGIFEVVVQGLPVGLGDHTQWDRKLDGRIGQAMMSIQAIKGVEIGLGFRAARLKGSQVHDAIEHVKSKAPRSDAGFVRPTNGAGGLEGGITNGAPLVVRVAMKPISTLMKPLMSVNIQTGEATKADVERSDYCALPAAAVVGENWLSFVLAQAFCEKFGGDSIVEMKRNYDGYLKQINKLGQPENAPGKHGVSEGGRE
ncbi:MAG: chorismate synthase [Planctomycetota bacterium]|nr:chorismate synthase [Planctomycetota bacterium]